VDSSWAEVLDSLTCQLDLQERALKSGYDAPSDVEIFPPSTPMTENERIRAAVLFQRCEDVLDEVTARIVTNRSMTRSPYSTGKRP
jgi:hypothetical protein